MREDKPPLVNQLCMVYHFKCDLRGAAYVGYTCRHLHQRFEEHKGSTGRNPLIEQHDLEPDHIYANYLYIFNLHLKMTSGRLKCRYFLLLVFIIKSISNKLLILHIAFENHCHENCELDKQMRFLS